MSFPSRSPEKRGSGTAVAGRFCVTEVTLIFYSSQKCTFPPRLPNGCRLPQVFVRAVCRTRYRKFTQPPSACDVYHRGTLRSRIASDSKARTRETIMKQKTCVWCVMLVAISISGTATAAPQKRERPHRPSLVEVIEHRVMAVVAVVEGAIARGGRAAMETKAKAAMEARAKAGMEAKAKAAREAKAKIAMKAQAKAGMAKRNASTEGVPCSYNNDRPALRSLSIDGPSSSDENRCR
jgi:hypothetical protein